MIAPAMYHQGRRVRFDRPDREWLENQYLMLDKSTWDIGREFRMSAFCVARWLKQYRIIKDVSLIRGKHSRRMSGDGNPAWIGGGSQNYQKGVLADCDYRCSWCRIEDDLQIHHRDHDRENCDPENLIWLCGPCNRMESQFRALMSRGRAEIVVNENAHEITIKFLNMEV